MSHPIVAAVYDPVTWIAEKTILRPHRRYLVQNLRGRVLDLGAGTGRLFPHVVEAPSPPRQYEYHALEPDPYMQQRAVERAQRLEMDITFGQGRAESLPYADNVFDIVISSMVFCTIPDIDTALDEISRVLKSGGEFRFFEHVAAKGWRHTLQQRLTPYWKRIAGGCHLDRQTAKHVVQYQEFAVNEVKRIPIGITPVRPFVRGRLTHRS